MVAIFSGPQCVKNTLLCDVDRLIFDTLRPPMDFQWPGPQALGHWEPCYMYVWEPVSNIIKFMYRQISNIRHTKSPNLNVSHLILQVSLCNLLKPGVK